MPGLERWRKARARQLAKDAGTGDPGENAGLVVQSDQAIWVVSQFGVRYRLVFISARQESPGYRCQNGEACRRYWAPERGVSGSGKPYTGDDSSDRCRH